MKTILRFLITLAGFLSLEAHAGSLRVNISPSQAVSAGAQWRVDGGSWRNSGSTASGLSNTTHTVDYKSVSGWIAPASSNVTVTSGTTTISATYVQAAALKVSLTPSSAQWRVDGGAWQASGATVSGLAPGSHTVAYSTVSGYAALASEPVTLTSGQTTNLARSYTQLAQVTVTLNPASAQWRIDGGAWLASGATATNLSVGSHTIDYATLNGYAAPASESVTLTAGQSLPLSRAYVQLAQVTVNLAGSVGNWRIDGGAWLASGAVAGNLAAGSHTIDYSPVNGYAARGSEAVSLTSGQSLTLSRSYTQLAQVTVSLTPASAQWRVDSGAWQAGGATVANLAPGSHTISYASLSGYTAPAPESITLASGQSLSLTRAYVQLAQVTVTLTPSTAQWRLDGGAWQASGTTMANLTPAAHTIDYSAVNGYLTPASEPVTLSPGQSLTLPRSYVQMGEIWISLVPSTGQWRANGGTWQASGSRQFFAPGTYTIEYSAVELYDAPANDTATLGAGGIFYATKTYTSQKPSLRFNLTPSTGQWRLDGGAWQASGAQLTELSTGAHTVDFSDLGDPYAPLASESVTLALRDNQTFYRTYTLKPASLSISLAPAAGTTWRAYPAGQSPGGAWQSSGATVNNLTPGNYTVEYGALGNYDAPATESLALAANENATLSRTYAAHPAQITVALTPATGTQWRIYSGTTPSGAWNAGGATVTGLAPGGYTLEYGALAGYSAPAAESVTLTAGQSASLSRDYTALTAQFTLATTPSSGQWRVYPSGGSPTGAWNASGATVTGLAAGTYSIVYTTLPGYGLPTLTSVVLAPGDSQALVATYPVSPAQINVALQPAAAQWRVDGGAWQPGGTTISGLSAGAHALEFAPVSGYATPSAKTITLNPGDSRNYSFPYVSQTPGLLTVKLTPATALWRVDGGAWNLSGATVGGLSTGAHTVEYGAVLGYPTPSSSNITISATEPTVIDYTYDHGNSSVTMLLNPTNGRYRVDGWIWSNSGSSTWFDSGVAHLFEYEPLAGYPTPQAEYIKLDLNQSITVNRAYQAATGASVSLGITPIQAQWRIYSGTTPSGAWQTGPASVKGLAAGTYTVEYAAVANYNPPASETLTLATGQDLILSRAYTTFPAQVTVTLNPAAAQWLISPSGGPESSTWLASGATVTNLAPGSYVITYGYASNYNTPYSETITVASGESRSLTKNYQHIYDLSVSLYPSQAQWRLDGGAWHASGDGVWDIPAGSHTLSYSEVAGYVTPPDETVSVTPGSPLTITRYYGQLSQLTVSLYPNTAQWRIDGGAWQPSGATVANLSSGNHTVDYAAAVGYVAPSSETVSFYSGEQKSMTRYYSPLAQLTVTLYPGNAQWRVDGGDWQASGATVANLSSGTTHTIEYANTVGYVAPTSETVTLYSGEQKSMSRYYSPLAQVTVTLYPGNAQWRVDGGAWQASGATVVNLSYGTTHTVEYATTTGYVAPTSETFTLYSGEQKTLTRYYSPLSQVTVTLYPGNAQWRIDGGAWQPSGATVADLSYGTTHTVEYAATAGYVAPTSETFTLYSGEQKTLSRYYSPLSQLTVTLYPATAQWRIDGGAWQASGVTVANLSYGTSHTVDYSTIEGYATLASETVTLYSGESKSLTRFYSALAQVTVTLTPSTAQWRVDGGAWQASGATVGNLALGSTHIIDYAPLAGYLTPASETFVSYSGSPYPVTKTYIADQHYVHRLRFFLHPDLVGSMPMEEVRRRISQYAAHLTQIFYRETLRTFTFDPAQDITLASSNPFSNSFTGTMPETGFEMWVYAQLTDNPTYGTYGGNAGLDTSGAGGAYNLRWDQIHDPAALVDNTEALAQYWRQIDHITHEFEHSFGAGLGEYYTLGGLKDASGVAPVLPDVDTVNGTANDPFWNARMEYWSDPLLANAYGNPRLGSPTSLATLLNITSFAPVTEGVINGLYRDYSRHAATLPNMSAVVVKVVHAQTGQPIPGATLRIWNRQRPAPPYDTYEEVVSATATPGVFTFAWTGTPVALNNYENAKILKAYATGFTPVAQWATAYDAQKAKVVEGKTTFEITIALTPQ